MAAPDTNPNLALFFAVWAAIGPMVGIFVGYILTSRQQRRQWMLDSRKEEFKEILTAMAEQISLVDSFIEATRAGDEQRTKELSAKVLDAYYGMSKTMMSRIYIVHDLVALKIPARYMDAIEEAVEEEFKGDTKRKLGGIMDDILKLALKG